VFELRLPQVPNSEKKTRSCIKTTHGSFTMYIRYLLPSCVWWHFFFLMLLLMHEGSPAHSSFLSQLTVNTLHKLHGDSKARGNK